MHTWFLAVALFAVTPAAPPTELKRCELPTPRPADSALPMLQSRIDDEPQYFRAHADGRIVAAVGKERTFLLDVESRKVLRILPGVLLDFVGPDEYVWRDGTNNVASSLRAPDHPREVADADETWPIPNSQLAVKRTPSYALVSGAGKRLLELPYAFPLGEELVRHWTANADIYGPDSAFATLPPEMMTALRALHPIQASADGSTLGDRGADESSVQLWSLSSGAPQPLPPVRFDGMVLSYAIAPKGAAVSAIVVHETKVDGGDPLCRESLEVSSSTSKTRVLEELGDCREIIWTTTMSTGNETLLLAPDPSDKDEYRFERTKRLRSYDTASGKRLWERPVRSAILTGVRGDVVLAVEDTAQTPSFGRSETRFVTYEPRTGGVAAFPEFAVRDGRSLQFTPTGLSIDTAGAQRTEWIFSRAERSVVAVQEDAPPRDHRRSAPPLLPPRLPPCEGRSCSRSVWVDSPSLGTIVAERVDAHSDMREVPATLEFWTRNRRSHDDRPLEGRIRRGFVAPDRKHLILVLDEPPEMFGTVEEKRWWRVEWWDLAKRKAVQRSELLYQVTTSRLAEDQRTLVVGTADGAVLALRDGVTLWRFAGPGGAVEEAVLSPDQKRIATRAHDGAVRLFDVATHSLIATFVEYSDDEWAITTPSGAFTGTFEVGQRLGFVFDNPLEFFSFERFPNLRDPDTVREALAGKPAAPFTLSRPPLLQVEPLPDPAGLPGVRHLRVRGASAGLIRSIEAFVEGRPAVTIPVCHATADVDVPVPLSGARNHVEFVAFDENGGASNGVSVELAGPPMDRPTIHIVSIGVSDYVHLPRLPATIADARGIAEAFGSQAGPERFYRAVTANVLLDSEATPEGIRSALDGLKEIAPGDVAVVLFAGHGLKPSAESDMVFATREYDPDAPAAVQATQSIGWSDVASRLAQVRGRVIVLLDACHSGHVTRELATPNEGLASALSSGQRAGSIIFASSKGRQVSFEGRLKRGASALDSDGDQARDDEPAPADSVTHGYFTWAVMQALSDPATDFDKDGAIEMSELISAATERVVTSSKGRQTPWVVRREIFGDFAVGRALPVAP